MYKELFAVILNRQHMKWSLKYSLKLISKHLFYVVFDFQPIRQPPTCRSAEMLLEKIMAAQPHPTREVEYSELYNYQDYKRNVAKKMAKMIR